MWIRVATNKNSVHIKNPISYSYIDGPNIKEYYFDEEKGKELEEAGFLNEMWEKFDAMFDWGDCDFFAPDKCELLKVWLENQLEGTAPKNVKSVYKIMLEYAEIAIKCDTGIYFDF